MKKCMVHVLTSPEGSTSVTTRIFTCLYHDFVTFSEYIFFLFLMLGIEIEHFYFLIHIHI